MTMLPMGAGTQMASALMPQQEKKPTGMFGSGKGRAIAEMLLGALSGYLTARGNPAGPMGLHAIQQRRTDENHEQQAQQDRENQFQDFVRKESWKLANQGPTNNDTVADYNFWKGVLPPEEFKQYVANKVNPPQLMNIPGVGVVQVPRMGGGAPTAPVGKLVPFDEGGPTPQASGGFPRPF